MGPHDGSARFRKYGLTGTLPVKKNFSGADFASKIIVFTGANYFKFIKTTKITLVYQIYM